MSWRMPATLQVTLVVLRLPRRLAMKKCNYGAEMKVLNLGRFAGSGLGHFVLKP